MTTIPFLLSSPLPHTFRPDKTLMVILETGGINFVYTSIRKHYLTYQYLQRTFGTHHNFVFTF